MGGAGLLRFTLPRELMRQECGSLPTGRLDRLTLGIALAHWAYLNRIGRKEKAPLGSGADESDRAPWWRGCTVAMNLAKRRTKMWAQRS